MMPQNSIPGSLTAYLNSFVLKIVIYPDFIHRFLTFYTECTLYTKPNRPASNTISSHDIYQINPIYEQQ